MPGLDVRWIHGALEAMGGELTRAVFDHFILEPV
jgi:hypothetical protein